jgi:hypothetical protein
VGPARIDVESLTLRPGIREQHRPNSDMAHFSKPQSQLVAGGAEHGSALSHLFFLVGLFLLILAFLKKAWETMLKAPHALS